MVSFVILYAVKCNDPFWILKLIYNLRTLSTQLNRGPSIVLSGYEIRDFPCLKLGIRDLKAKSRRDSGLKVCAGGGTQKITLGITGLHEILSRDYVIEEP